MKTMGLSRSRIRTEELKENFYCPVRKEWVAALPEERVRQQLIEKMVTELGYPFGCFAVERALQQMPHLMGVKHSLPLRRADIICFAKGIHPQYDLYPMLLIECKAVPLTAAVVRQIVGYNYYLQARYIAIANQQEVRTGWVEANQTQYTFTNGLPHYHQLLQSLQQDK
jgi:hypothetical protein